MWRRIGAIIVCVCCLLGMNVVPAQSEGAWGQINQDLQRPETWERIVVDSGFALGEGKEITMGSGETFYDLSFGTYPSIDGSTVSVPMVMEFARQHLSLPESDLQGFVFLSTTHYAYEHLIGKRPNGSAMVQSLNAAMDENHPVDLIIVTGPSPEELALAEENGVILVQKPVCYDAFVFITHKDNPVDSLTVEQIQKIYTGEITNWKEVGGQDAKIAPYQREPNSGSQTAMEGLVMQGQPMDAAEPNYVVGSMEGLVRRVGNYENSEASLGYTYLYYIDTLYKDSGIKTLAIDGIAPTEENLRSGAYPFTTNYYGVIRGGEEEGVGGRFLDWMLSEEGQRCIAQAGYIPMEPIQ